MTDKPLVLEATTAAYPGYLKRVEIHGSEGSAILEEEDLKAWDFAKQKKEDRAILEQMKQHKSTGGGARGAGAARGSGCGATGACGSGCGATGTCGSACSATGTCGELAEPKAKISPRNTYTLHNSAQQCVFVPVDGVLQSFFKRHLRLKAK